MRRIIFGVCLIMSGALCQSIAPHFEVADVRATPGGQPTRAEFTAGALANKKTLGSLQLGQIDPTGIVTLRRVTMRQLIGSAYKEIAGPEYLKGGPSWIDLDLFDLLAKAAPDTPADTERLMIQSVLAERFHLVVHREPKSMRIFALVAGRGGPKFQSATDSGPPRCDPAQRDDRVGLVCHNVTMQFFVERLPSNVQPVTDQTDIKGRYDFRLDWAGRPVNADIDPSPTVFESLEKELGLKLEERKQAVSVIVIDSVDRAPTPN